MREKDEMMAARPWLCCPPRILRLLLHCPALVWCGPLWTLTLTLIDSARGCCNSEATARKLVGTSPRVYPCFRARLSARRCLALRRGRRGSVAPCLHCCLTPRGPPSLSASRASRNPRRRPTEHDDQTATTRTAVRSV